MPFVPARFLWTRREDISGMGTHFYPSSAKHNIRLVKQRQIRDCAIALEGNLALSLFPHRDNERICREGRGTGREISDNNYAIFMLSYRGAIARYSIKYTWQDCAIRRLSLLLDLGHRLGDNFDLYINHFTIYHINETFVDFVFPHFINEGFRVQERGSVCVEWMWWHYIDLCLNVWPFLSVYNLIYIQPLLIIRSLWI